MTKQELTKINENYFRNEHSYTRVLFTLFNYQTLKRIMYAYKNGRGQNNSVNDCWIMLDTETSKEHKNATYIEDGKTKYKPVQNYVCAFTISIRAYHTNIVTLYGSKPSDAVRALQWVLNALRGHETIVFIHNLAYDWVFLRKFLFSEFGHPDSQLNTKSHNPIAIRWTDTGLTLRDSYILAQRRLEKWADDLDVPHKKAVGKWDYDLIRDQEGDFTDDELDYIECDTLAGVECLDALATSLNKDVWNLPYTATGIPREQVRKLASANKWRPHFKKLVPTLEQFKKLLKVYHGGYTHANRHRIDQIIKALIICLDFTSSYPYCLIAFKYPMEQFTAVPNCSAEDILRVSNRYACMFKLTLVNVRLKDDKIAMPALQYSKCEKSVNECSDNGRILCADYLEIYLTEIDLLTIVEQYEWDRHICSEVEVAYKEYLPRWFTDYVYECFVNKTQYKDGDPVLYSLAKAKLNSLYGMCVQRSIKEVINEDYESGEYFTPEFDEEAEYEKYTNKRSSVLPYQWGVWCTAYAMRNLFVLGGCCNEWLYSDTDSCYSASWNMELVEAYNEEVRKLLLARGYGPVSKDSKEYWLGIAEVDGNYTEFRTQGSKRYCCRISPDAKEHAGELKLTVAGVPKKYGAKCLNNDIGNFAPGFVFSGLITEKKEHTYIYTERIEERNGIEFGDSIDLTPCDYTLDSVDFVDWFSLFYDEIEVQVYE